MNGVGGGWDCSPCLTMGVGENPLTLGNSWTNRELQAFRACRNSYGRSFLPATCMSKDRLGHDKRARRIMPAVVPVPQALPKDASSMRVFVISDLHTDYTENMAWVKKISSATFKQDTLIVAGDVAETLKTFEKTMALLKDRFRHVFFIPGNHDLWCRNVGSEKHMHSLEKLRRILNICRNLGVETEPKLIKRVGIIPLFSWYHQSFDKEPDIPGYKFPPLKLVCRDFQACKWHSPCSNIGDKLAIYFDNLNLEFWAAVEELTSNADQIISFSHFLPRLELCPEKRMLFYPNLPKVVGSDYLEVRIREIHGLAGSPSACHVFGHTHFCWDATLDGIRYIQAPLAYPAERLRRINGGGDWLPFCIYNSDSGGLINGPSPFYWSQYYLMNKRDPSNIQLAPWVNQFYKAVPDKI